MVCLASKASNNNTRLEIHPLYFFTFYNFILNVAFIYGMLCVNRFKLNYSANIGDGVLLKTPRPRGSGVFRISKGGAKCSLDNSAHTKGGGQTKFSNFFTM